MGEEGEKLATELLRRLCYDPEDHSAELQFHLEEEQPGGEFGVRPVRILFGWNQGVRCDLHPCAGVDGR